mmetsp:Transcript_23461/g.79499  ORF Transcript_23461/g.79499 Transcript_23461/m.79499 type:complete len:262 (-) Transcript_23461:424-1209(-)
MITGELVASVPPACALVNSNLLATTFMARSTNDVAAEVGWSLRGGSWTDAERRVIGGPISSQDTTKLVGRSCHSLELPAMTRNQRVVVLRAAANVSSCAPARGHAHRLQLGPREMHLHSHRPRRRPRRNGALVHAPAHGLEAGAEELAEGRGAEHRADLAQCGRSCCRGPLKCTHDCRKRIRSHTTARQSHQRNSFKCRIVGAQSTHTERLRRRRCQLRQKLVGPATEADVITEVTTHNCLEFEGQLFGVFKFIGLPATLR